MACQLACAGVVNTPHRTGRDEYVDRRIMSRLFNQTFSGLFKVDRRENEAFQTRLLYGDDVRYICLLR